MEQKASMSTRHKDRKAHRYSRNEVGDMFNGGYCGKRTRQQIVVMSIVLKPSRCVGGRFLNFDSWNYMNRRTDAVSACSIRIVCNTPISAGIRWDRILGGCRGVSSCIVVEDAGLVSTSRQ